MLYAATVIRECQHAAEINTFYKGLFRAAVREMTEKEFNSFCREVLQLYHYHEATAGKWCTDMPQLFTDRAQHFYKIAFPVDKYSTKYLDHFFVIIQCKTPEETFDKRQFFILLEEISDRQFYFFCNHILQLDLHRVYAQTLWYTDDSELAKRSDGGEISAILSPLAAVAWTSPLYFRVKKKKK